MEGGWEVEKALLSSARRNRGPRDVTARKRQTTASLGEGASSRRGHASGKRGTPSLINFPRGGGGTSKKPSAVESETRKVVKFGARLTEARRNAL